MSLLNPDRRVTGIGSLRKRKFVCDTCNKDKFDYYSPKHCGKRMTRDNSRV